MKKIGLTGGIGSGKSTVAKIFETLKIPVYYSDYWAKELINSNSVIIEALTQKYGNDIYLNGKINKEKFASIIFSDKKELEFVNSIVHPEVKKHFDAWCNEQSQHQAGYIIKEAAILFESGAYKQVDKIITVSANIPVRVSRVVQRDKIPEELVYKKIKNQMTDEEKIKRSDFVIYNNPEDLLIPQVLKIHKVLG